MRSQTGQGLPRKRNSCALSPLSCLWIHPQMEGINFHIASYFYVQEDGWTCSHSAQLSACSLRRDAAESQRWTCWACAQSCKGKMSPLHFFKTSAEQLEHFYLHDSTDAHWAFAKQAAKLGVTANELCIAVIGKDLKISPLPTGQPLELVPKTLPSHPKGHSKLITKAPWNRTISPYWYESEKGLPWLEGAIPGTEERRKQILSPLLILAGRFLPLNCSRSMKTSSHHDPPMQDV